MNAMPFYYQSGEEIRKGDRVTFHGEPGRIEFVVDKLTGDPAMDWYMNEFEGGAMIVEPKHFGGVFLHETGDAEDLILVALILVARA
jgi:hypothetical protein